MSREQYSRECLPVTTCSLDGETTVATPAPTHVGCPGGSHRVASFMAGAAG